MVYYTDLFYLLQVKQHYPVLRIRFSITNISVIEITDDTNLPRINYEGFSYQDALGSEEIVNGGFDTCNNWRMWSTIVLESRLCLR